MIQKIHWDHYGENENEYNSKDWRFYSNMVINQEKRGSSTILTVVKGDMENKQNYIKK